MTEITQLNPATPQYTMVESSHETDTVNIMLPCCWCYSATLEVSFARSQNDLPTAEVTNRDGTSGAEDDSPGYKDDISIQSMLFDRFKGSSCGDEAALLEVCSKLVGIQQPICKDCARDILEELSTGIRDLREEGSSYEKLLLHSTRPIVKPATTILEADEGSSVFYEKKCKILREELNNLEQAKRAQDRIRKIESLYWKYYNILNLHLHDAANLRDALQLQMDQSNHCLETLMPTTRHVLADILDIETDGQFGMISGCVMGGISPQWWEINTAWGQAVLLLDILRELLAVQFKGGSIILDPCGSYPRIFEKGKGYHELYGPVSKLFCLGFDKGQVLFLECIQQIEAELQERQVYQGKARFVLPYAIEGDKVGGSSIRYSFSRDKVWSEALRNMLQNLEACLHATLEFQGAKDITRSHAITPS